MRNSGILKVKNMNYFKNNKLSNNGSAQNSEKGKKWIHNADALLKGHVVYLVKFLGSTEVDQPKGIEVVKQGIQKLKFNQELKKSEGVKTPKVELTISVDGVTIQEPKTKKLLHEYALHKISYCADDKAEKGFFSFIAKEGDENKHTCFVFVSDKLAEEITLTIGQAFELAYKKFLDTSNKEMEVKKQLLVLQKRIAILEGENAELKKRLVDVQAFKDVQAYMDTKGLKDLCLVRESDGVASASACSAAGVGGVGGGGGGSDSGHEDGGSKSPASSETGDVTLSAATAELTNPVPASATSEKAGLNVDLINIETEVNLQGHSPGLVSDDFDPRGGADPSNAVAALDGDDGDEGFDPRASSANAAATTAAAAAAQSLSAAAITKPFPPAAAAFLPPAAPAAAAFLPPAAPAAAAFLPPAASAAITLPTNAPPALPPRGPAKLISLNPFDDSFTGGVAGNPFATDPFGMSAFEAAAAAAAAAAAHRSASAPTVGAVSRPLSSSVAAPAAAAAAAACGAANDALLGFQTGLTMGTMQMVDFSLDELDPLKN